MKEDTGHSPVGASSRYRWSHCPGSVRECKKIPPAVSSKYAEEGTLAHTHAAFFLENGRWQGNCDNEMIEQLSVYTNQVIADRNSLDRTVHGNLILIEHGFALDMLHPDAWGTADAVIYDAKRKILYVHDLKYGAGIGVEVEEEGEPNEQLVYYAVGAFLSLNLPAEKVVLRIAQPRCPHPDGLIRSMTFDALELLDHAATIEAEIKATDDPNAPLVAGDHCRFCPAAGVCPQLYKKAMVTTKAIFASTSTYEPDQLALTLDKLPMLEAFVKQVREFAYGEAMKGRLPPGYKLVAKRPTRKWKEERGIGKFLSKNLETPMLKSCYTEPELKSPAQIEKILPKDKHESLKEFIKSESSGYKLVHESENGEPILLDAKTVFGEPEAVEDNCESLFQ